MKVKKNVWKGCFVHVHTRAPRVADFRYRQGLSRRADLGAWQIFDIVKGSAGVLTWVLLVIFSLGGLFELGEIFESKNPAAPEEERQAEAKNAAV